MLGRLIWLISSAGGEEGEMDIWLNSQVVEVVEVSWRREGKRYAGMRRVYLMKKKVNPAGRASSHCKLGA